MFSTIHGAQFFGHIVRLFAETYPLPRGLLILLLAVTGWGALVLAVWAVWTLSWHVSALFLGGVAAIG